MRYLALLIIVYGINVASSDDSTNKDYLDPSNVEDNAFLWKSLFTKLNTLVNESENFNKNFLDLNKRFDELSKRQNDQENRLTKLMENISDMRGDFTKRLNSQDVLLRNAINYTHPWTTIQRRQDGSVDFYRSWNEYGIGFGNPNGEFFIGLQKLHDLTTYGLPQELLIILKDFDGQTRYAKYDNFRIGSEAEKYALLEVGAYSGDAGDALTSHKGHKFTTRDQDNDNNDSRNCAEVFQGGWWFYDLCYHGYLNGPYRQEGAYNNWGISWNPFREWNHSLKYAEMMIRPKV